MPMPKSATRAWARTIRIVVVEPHALVRASLREIVSGEPDLDVVGEGADIDAAIQLSREMGPDVVLVGSGLSGPAAVESVQRLTRQCPGSPVVLLGQHPDDQDLFMAVQAGAAAHVIDRVRPSALAEAIRGVAAGEYLIDRSVAARPAVARRVLEVFREASLMGQLVDHHGSQRAMVMLSSRETDVLTAIGNGMSNKDIAAALSISQHTVSNHVKSVLRKLAVNNRTQAVLVALRNSWIELPERGAFRPH
jgi:DNA-binding NarL/FixJ family response regulator